MTMYIRHLERELYATLTAAEPTKPDLRQRVITWFDSQPEISRMRAYSMVELERALGTQGRFLSPILGSLGWERRRKWSTNGASSRYWVPPSA